MANQIPPPVAAPQQSSMPAWAARTCASDSWSDSDSDIDDRIRHRRGVDFNLMRNVAPTLYAISAALPPPSFPPCLDRDFNLTVVLKNTRSQHLDFAIWNSHGPSSVGPVCPDLIGALSAWMRKVTPDAHVLIGGEFWLPVRISLRGREQFERFCGLPDSDPDLQLVGLTILANDYSDGKIANFHAMGYTDKQLTVLGGFAP